MDHLCIIVAMTIYPNLTAPQIHQFQDAQRVCEKIADRAIDVDVDPLMALAVAVEETRLRSDVTSPAGAKGPMQVLPKYWCPKSPKSRPCDYVGAGLKALKYYMKKGTSERDGLRRYAGAGKGARDYAERVLRRYNNLVALLTAIDGC
jgi:hypothetical protein